MNSPFARRPTDRTELLVADAISLCGILAESILATSIGLKSEATLLRSLQARFFCAVHNIELHPVAELSGV